MKFVKMGERQVNIEQIASFVEDDKYFYVRMSNADAYRVDKNVYTRKLFKALTSSKSED